MDELINLVSQRTGIPADKAQMAIQTVLGFVKEKLPAPMAAQLDSLVAGGSDGASNSIGDIGSMAKGLGGLFGGTA
jgi:hypothetical protein